MMVCGRRRRMYGSTARYPSHTSAAYMIEAAASLEKALHAVVGESIGREALQRAELAVAGLVADTGASDTIDVHLALLKELKDSGAKPTRLVPNRDGTITCTTCHNPHQYGLFPADSPLAYQAIRSRASAQPN